MSPSLRPDFASPLPRLLAVGAFAGVAVLGGLDRGATRMHATPWTVLLLATQLAPLLALAWRAFATASPLALPSRGWCLALGTLAASLLGSAAASPYAATSLLATLTPLAGLAAFCLVYDAHARTTPDRIEAAERLVTWLLLGLCTLSLGAWLLQDLWPVRDQLTFASLVDRRNAHPLGHSNYTAGLALLALPLTVSRARQAIGLARAGWSLAALLPLAALLSSGSRGGLLGLGALLLAGLALARLDWRRVLLGLLTIALFTAGVALLHPRTRALLFRSTDPVTAATASNEQRRAMLDAAVQLGLERPLSGWGTGTTPLAYPRMRASLAGGTENVLQLHSTPLQLWADLGLPGLLAAAALLALGLRNARRHRPAAALLAGYGVFALTDYQLDVPLFTAALAAALALLARPPRHRAPPPGFSSTPRRILGVVTLLALTLLLGCGRRDPAPALNVRALALARDPAQADAALALLRSSLALNPDQEIAHFNLGWLLVVGDPATAERHFLAAAHLVPDKGGVYFGLALSRLNQGPTNPTAVVHALALECLNDPRFLTSPWWREPAFAPLRAATLAAFARLARDAALLRIAAAIPLQRELRYLPLLADWLDGHGSISLVLAAAQTSARVGYFARRPSPPDLAAARVLAYRRERTGYPVLMRDLDLPVPTDLFLVQENELAATELAFLFPAKGWLPAPVLMELLASPAGKSDETD